MIQNKNVVTVAGMFSGKTAFFFFLFLLFSQCTFLSTYMQSTCYLWEYKGGQMVFALKKLNI